ncbi:CRS1 / YhbY (CRM) domain protein [uncultured archaeon]|nr:CRS1 / YhbY (CRM) domain protein [uncultured archaeon]
MQLGKNGITENFIQTLKNAFQTRESIRISVLKSAGHEKETIKKYSDELLEKLGVNYTSKLIGFKIIIRKWRKAKR